MSTGGGPAPTVLERSRIRQERLHRARRMYPLYVIFLIPAATLLIFRYLPMYGVIIAFKDFRITRGIWASPWVGLEHFRDFFLNPLCPRLLRNTVVISLLRIVFGFPAPIVPALLINEIRGAFGKRAIQSISSLPHFMSWVVLAGILFEVLSAQRGLVGMLFTALGKPAPNVLNSVGGFRPLLIVTDIWKEIGWATVVYFAAIASIDPALYESAAIDGANRLERAVYITLPSLTPVMAVLFLLRLGYILDAGFDQIFNMYNPLVYEVADIIDTYVYRRGLIDRQYDFSSAVGLFKNVLGLGLMLSANAVVRKFSEYGIW